MLFEHKRYADDDRKQQTTVSTNNTAFALHRWRARLDAYRSAQSRRHTSKERELRLMEKAIYDNPVPVRTISPVNLDIFRDQAFLSKLSLEERQALARSDRHGHEGDGIIKSILMSTMPIVIGAGAGALHWVAPYTIPPLLAMYNFRKHPVMMVQDEMTGKERPATESEARLMDPFRGADVNRRWYKAVAEAGLGTVATSAALAYGGTALTGALTGIVGAYGAPFLAAAVIINTTMGVNRQLVDKTVNVLVSGQLSDPKVLHAVNAAQTKSVAKRHDAYTNRTLSRERVIAEVFGQNSAELMAFRRRALAWYKEHATISNNTILKYYNDNLAHHRIQIIASAVTSVVLVALGNTISSNSWGAPDLVQAASNPSTLEGLRALQGYYGPLGTSARRTAHLSLAAMLRAAIVCGMTSAKQVIGIGSDPVSPSLRAILKREAGRHAYHTVRKCTEQRLLTRFSQNKSALASAALGVIKFGGGVLLTAGTNAVTMGLVTGRYGNMADLITDTVRAKMRVEEALEDESVLNSRDPVAEIVQSQSTDSVVDLDRPANSMKKGVNAFVEMLDRTRYTDLKAIENQCRADLDIVQTEKVLVDRDAQCVNVAQRLNPVLSKLTRETGDPKYVSTSHRHRCLADSFKVVAARTPTPSLGRLALEGSGLQDPVVHQQLRVIGPGSSASTSPLLMEKVSNVVGPSVRQHADLRSPPPKPVKLLTDTGETVYLTPGAAAICRMVSSHDDTLVDPLLLPMEQLNSKHAVVAAAFESDAHDLAQQRGLHNNSTGAVSPWDVYAARQDAPRQFECAIVKMAAGYDVVEELKQMTGGGGGVTRTVDELTIHNNVLVSDGQAALGAEMVENEVYAIQQLLQTNYPDLNIGMVQSGLSSGDKDIIRAAVEMRRSRAAADEITTATSQLLAAPGSTAKVPTPVVSSARLAQAILDGAERSEQVKVIRATLPAEVMAKVVAKVVDFAFWWSFENE